MLKDPYPQKRSDKKYARLFHAAAPIALLFRETEGIISRGK